MQKLPSYTASMHCYLLPSQTCPYVSPLRALLQPAPLHGPTIIRARFATDNGSTQSKYSTETSHSSRSSNVNGHRFQEWKGSSTQDHATNRAARNDITDPEVEGVAKGIAERQQNSGIADSTLSGATTQRDLRGSAKRAKTEHPKSPEPIIGMNDERGEVS